MYVACTLIQLEWHFPQRSWACFVLVFVSLEGRVRLQYSRSNTKQMPKNRKCDKAHCREKASLSHAEGAKSMAPEEPCQGLSVLSLGQCGGTDGEGGKPRREGLLVQMAPLNQPAQLFLLIHETSRNAYPVTTDPEIKETTSYFTREGSKNMWGSSCLPCHFPRAGLGLPLEPFPTSDAKHRF